METIPDISSFDISSLPFETQCWFTSNPPEWMLTDKARLWAEYCSKQGVPVNWWKFLNDEIKLLSKEA